LGDFERSDLEIGPPRNLMAEAVQFAMMLTTKWHGELIAHLESQRNQIEVWFSILQGQSLSGTSFSSLKQLQDHIDAYVNACNDRA
jgi:hypothetical protein